MNNNKKFFIIGMRRSGTSILRELIRSHPDIQDVEFETHILRYALQCMEIPRYRGVDWALKEIDRFKNINNKTDKWHGIKYALNPGVFDLEWAYLYHYFPEARFIFIMRDKCQTYKSYKKLDKDIKRGYAPWNCYSPFFDLITNQFIEYNKNNPEKSCIIEYKNLVDNVDAEIKKAWNLLELEPKIRCNGMMKIPENWSK